MLNYFLVSTNTPNVPICDSPSVAVSGLSAPQYAPMIDAKHSRTTLKQWFRSSGIQDPVQVAVVIGGTTSGESSTSRLFFPVVGQNHVSSTTESSVVIQSSGGQAEWRLFFAYEKTGITTFPGIDTTRARELLIQERKRMPFRAALRAPLTPFGWSGANWLTAAPLLTIAHRIVIEGNGASGGLSLPFFLWTQGTIAVIYVLGAVLRREHNFTLQIREVLLASDAWVAITFLALPSTSLMHEYRDVYERMANLSVEYERRLVDKLLADQRERALDRDSRMPPFPDSPPEVPPDWE